MPVEPRAAAGFCVHRARGLGAIGREEETSRAAERHIPRGG